jgi:hypothetical protein
MFHYSTEKLNKNKERIKISNRISWVFKYFQQNLKTWQKWRIEIQINKRQTNVLTDRLFKIHNWRTIMKKLTMAYGYFEKGQKTKYLYYWNLRSSWESQKCRKLIQMNNNIKTPQHRERYKYLGRGGSKLSTGKQNQVCLKP